MNKRIITIIIALAAVFVSQAVHSQTITLVGQVQDVFLKKPLVPKIQVYETDSTTCVLDSVRVERIEDVNGDIIIAPYYAPVKAAPHDYLIRVELPGYDVEWLKVSVTNTTEKELAVPLIKMRRARHVTLNEVVVTATKVKMFYRGDTLIYDATAFNMPDGSMLDDLIRQMPGVTLKDNGEILVNGRRVDYLTLNGTDFFKGNNRMMLDNLPYYTVKNIKVYDKSTDVSQFLGYDAEKKDYVMDVVLKREYSVGLTANAEVGGGTKERWLARLFGLRFTDHSRLTVFGNSNNINETGRPGESGEWKAADPTNGITTHGEVNANLRSEDRYKRWKNELAVSLTDDKNDRQSQQESEYYLQGGGEYAHRGHAELTRDRKVDVTNTFTRNKSTSPVYLASMVGYRYGYDRTEREESARVNTGLSALYRLDDRAKRRSNNHQVFTSNQMLVKLPWGDRLNLHLDGQDGLYGQERLHDDGA